jgi:hypothetical protein
MVMEDFYNNCLAAMRVFLALWHSAATILRGGEPFWAIARIIQKGLCLCGGSAMAYPTVSNKPEAGGHGATLIGDGHACLVFRGHTPDAIG